MITVLRLGHRVGRDDRISTHCGLVARALGANSIIYSGEKDDKMLESVCDVAKRFGGKFTAGYEASWKKAVAAYRKKKFTVVHLTAYGMPLQKNIGKVRKSKKILIIVGSEKVPGEVYRLSDFNISVTNQPHSEVASLAIFINQYVGEKSLEQKFHGAKIRIVPQERGKKVEDS